MKLDSMMCLYVAELQDMHDGEMQLIKALPKLARGATSEGLTGAILTHLEETKEQARRLEKILSSMDKKPGTETCEAMEGLITEGDELMKAKGEPAVKDAGLIIAAQKVEHYEIAGYGSLCALARLLGRDEDADLLRQSLDEEKNADETLTDLAEGTVNDEAVAASETTKRTTGSSSRSKRPKTAHKE